MSEETKCPKCGAEVVTNEFGVVDYKCESWANTPKNTFEQSEICTLRAALLKALGECESEGGPCSCHESYLSLKAAGYRRDDPNCVYCNVTQYPIKTLRDALSTLARAENGDL